ncbi:MAG TPA: hypothetical protein VGR78_02645, partial [Verrucomicrobiae bacterium]|nr:hypothetical protein [Verrucomicrobiae bacterium]
VGDKEIKDQTIAFVAAGDGGADRFQAHPDFSRDNGFLPAAGIKKQPPNALPISSIPSADSSRWIPQTRRFSIFEASCS